MTLQEWLTANEISHRQFAREIGTSQQNVSGWCRGKTPKLAMAMKIQEYTDGEVSVEAWI